MTIVWVVIVKHTITYIRQSIYLIDSLNHFNQYLDTRYCKCVRAIKYLNGVPQGQPNHKFANAITLLSLLSYIYFIYNASKSLILSYECKFCQIL